MSAALTLTQASNRAQMVIASANKLTRAAETLSDANQSRNPQLIDAAELLRDNALLNHRIGTTPEQLLPILQTLLAAAGIPADG